MANKPAGPPKNDRETGCRAKPRPQGSALLCEVREENLKNEARAEKRGEDASVHHDSGYPKIFQHQTRQTSNTRLNVKCCLIVAVQLPGRFALIGKKTRALETQIEEDDFLELAEECHTTRGHVAPATPSLVLPGVL
ncbi:hypothetical protein CVT26_002377 [Gymnopilus dilepis]|uniref:Uncharacterized protein n=1 Tax=Gymnopilus dilepis TaxID=231916 RepID=A0A409Y3P9_9AGAR|nr:hypothetical protein CVT26_002377 [Gymnopilus dilepis]